MADVPELTIGRPSGDHLSLRVTGRMHPGSSDYWDGNWLIAPIRAQLGDFTARLDAALRINELQTLRQGLEQVDQDLRGQATLTSIEHWISLTVTCRSSGSLTISGELDDDHGRGNILRFAIDGLDQSDIPQMIDSLNDIEEAYPILGK